MVFSVVRQAFDVICIAFWFLVRDIRRVRLSHIISTAFNDGGLLVGLSAFVCWVPSPGFKRVHQAVEFLQHGIHFLTQVVYLLASSLEARNLTFVGTREATESAIPHCLPLRVWRKIPCHHHSKKKGRHVNSLSTHVRVIVGAGVLAFSSTSAAVVARILAVALRLREEPVDQLHNVSLLANRGNPRGAVRPPNHTFFLRHSTQAFQTRLPRSSSTPAAGLKKEEGLCIIISCIGGEKEDARTEGESVVAVVVWLDVVCARLRGACVCGLHVEANPDDRMIVETRHTVVEKPKKDTSRRYETVRLSFVYFFHPSKPRGHCCTSNPVSRDPAGNSYWRSRSAGFSLGLTAHIKKFEFDAYCANSSVPQISEDALRVCCGCTTAVTTWFYSADKEDASNYPLHSFSRIGVLMMRLLLLLLESAYLIMAW